LLLLLPVAAAAAVQATKSRARRAQQTTQHTAKIALEIAAGCLVDKRDIAKKEPPIHPPTRHRDKKVSAASAQQQAIDDRIALVSDRSLAGLLLLLANNRLLLWRQDGLLITPQCERS
jgi:hypothetical protein